MNQSISTQSLNQRWSTRCRHNNIIEIEIEIDEDKIKSIIYRHRRSHRRRRRV